MEVLKDKYRTVNFESDNKILYSEWYKETEFMTVEEYKHAAFITPDLAKKYGADKILMNIVNFKFLVVPVVQDWINKNAVPKYLKFGVKKMAILLPTEIFSQVSVGQILNDAVDVAQEKIKYFDKEDESRKWLLSK